MNFSQITTDIDFLCGSTSASYPLVDKTRNVNISYNDVARLVWESAGGWQYDDTNATTLPIATATLVHSQQDYSLPSTAQRLERVEVKDSVGNWHKVEYMDVHDITIASNEYKESDGLPVYYDILGRSILLYPAPHSASVTLTNGLQIYVNRNVTEFPTTATTTEPGFAIPFHRILSYAAAIDFIQDENQRRHLIIQKDRLEKGMVRFYSKRPVEGKSQIKPATKKRWRQYT